MRVACLIIVAAWVTLGCGGCNEPAGPRTVGSDNLAIKIPAIKEAARSDDLSAVPQLVKDLESDDPAVRMYAILGLRELTGEDFGYVYFAGREDREPAVEKWRTWVEEQQQRPSRSATPKTRR